MQSTNGVAGVTVPLLFYSAWKEECVIYEVVPINAFRVERRIRRYWGAHLRRMIDSSDSAQQLNDVVSPPSVCDS